MSTSTDKKNHIIIGLGGTGGRVLRAFRKSIFQEFRTKDPEIAGLRLAYLYVDSSPEIMPFDHQSWKILGESVQLSGKSQLLITGADLTDRLNQINAYPGIQYWIGERKQWNDILNSTVGAVLGGQKRRLGRFLFSCLAGEFRVRITDLVSALETGGTKGTTFHICCGLAGGTGSGSVVDAVTQIRDLYAIDPKNYRIRIYAYIPELHPKADWDTGNYHANGYAALLELNALSVGTWIPHDVTGKLFRKGAVTPSDQRRFDPSNFRDPFTGCYVYTNVNANGVQVDVENELPAIVSDFLYQKIVTSRTVDLADVDRMENIENRTDTAEVKDRTMEKIRSKAFLTFGIKRLAIPEEEIKEYLTYHFARQAALQMSFNNWSDDFGFTDEASNAEFNSFVRLRENLAKWKMSDEHLTLSIGILPEEAANKDWKTLSNEWKTIAAGFKDLARGKDQEQWLDTLEQLYEDRFNEKFRKLGVKRYYQIKLRAKRDIVREIRETVESELFAEWKHGGKSIVEIGRVITALVSCTEERKETLVGQIQKEREKEPKEQRDVEANKVTWARLGVFSRMVLHKDDRLLDAQSICLERLYLTRTQIEALDFAKQLLIELITELNALKSDVDRCATTVSEGLRFFETNAISRCADEGETDYRKNVIRFYEPARIREICKSFVKDGDKQRTQVSSVRAKLAAALGDKQSFVQFNLSIVSDKFIDICQLQCAENVEQVHEAFVLENRGKGRLFGANIIEKLEEKFRPDSDELQRFIKELVDHSGVLLSFNSGQIALSNVPSVPKSMQPSHMFLVIRPKDPSRKAFVDSLEKNFSNFSQGPPVLFVDSVGKMNEISLIRISTCFPLRFIEPLKFLKERYDQRITGANVERAKLEIHLEGDGTQHPSLFVQSLDELKQSALPYLLLAKVLELIVSHKNNTTGTTELIIPRKNADGTTIPPIRLGTSVIDAYDSLSWDASEEIQRLVKSELLAKNNLHADRHQSLRENLNTDLQQLLASVGNNFDDPTFIRFQVATEKAIQILKGGL